MPQSWQSLAAVDLIDQDGMSSTEPTEIQQIDAVLGFSEGSASQHFEGSVGTDVGRMPLLLKGQHHTEGRM